MKMPLVERHFFTWDYVVLEITSPSPQPSPNGRGGKGADLCWFQDLSSMPEFQVGVTRIFTSVSPLSLWERVRVRGGLKLEYGPL
jgi:hypothetical protein